MSKCVRDGCAGTYEADGYCDTCGGKAPVSVPAQQSQPRSQPVTSSPVTGTGANRLATITQLDPLSAVLPDPQVPEHRRKCTVCGKQPGRMHGFCTGCGNPYSYIPGLAKSDRIKNDRYEVQGCIAYGGLGWIYLALDKDLTVPGADHWVVLKGLINSDDPDAAASALNERQFLVEVDHPNIVKIQDFARHHDPHTGREVGYIVMEYLGGRSLQDIFLNHRDSNDEPAPLPLPTVLHYGKEILAAFRYLHEKNLVYCDLKPNNVIQVGKQVKLIDLGAVLRMSKRRGAVYGTIGYQAPEIEDGREPSVASDIYTLGRMLAVLSFDFVGFTRGYRHRLPDPADIPLLAREESFHRLLLRATDQDPSRRFGSAEEMAEQLDGVLAEVLSIEDGKRRPRLSDRFTSERRTFGTDAGSVTSRERADRPGDWAAVAQSLPTPLVDLTDPAAPFLATLGATEPEELVATLQTHPQQSPEVLLRLVDAHIAAGDLAAARADLDQFAQDSPNDWRTEWFTGVTALAAGDPRAAGDAFDTVYSALPGELAPKLALAAAAEWDGDDDRAEALYRRVWRTDAGFVSAAFGLARVLRRHGRPGEVVDALDDVPNSSSQHVLAQVAAIRARIDQDLVDRIDLVDASSRLRRLQMDLERQALLSIEVLTAKLDWVLSNGGPPDPDFEERQLRQELEKAYRNLAKVAEDAESRAKLVDLANTVRPKTLW
jgi:serine/threonine-protein kinase PknG